MNSLKYELQPSRLDQGAQGRGRGRGRDVGGSSSAIGYIRRFTAENGYEVFYLVARVLIYELLVNKTARPYILFMSKAIDQSLFAFYCTKTFLFSDRSPESNQARLTHELQLSQHFRPLTTRTVITVEPRFTVTRLIRTPRCLVPRRLSFDENVRAKEGRKETTGFACRLYPSHGPLRFITSHSRFALASAKRKTKRLRRRLDTSLLRAVSFVLGKRKPLHLV